MLEPWQSGWWVPGAVFGGAGDEVQSTQSKVSCQNS